MPNTKIRLFISTHVFYKDLYLYPPEGINWQGNYNIKDFENLRLYDAGPTLFRKYIKNIYDFIKMPRFIYLFNIKNCDMIYSTRGISILNKIPWIVDFEHVSHFVGLDRKLILNENIKKNVKKFLNLKWCKKILPNTYAALQSFKNIFGEDLVKKMKVLYQTMQPTPLLKRNPDDKIVILFNGNFYHKGGNIALKIFEILNQHYNNLEMIIISNPQEGLIMKYKKKYSNIKFFKKGSNISRSQLINDYFMKSDIFLYPSQGDSNFPAVLLGMNAALPIVCSDYYAFPEIIENDVNGFLIHSHLGDIEREYPKRIINYWKGEDQKIIHIHEKEFIAESIDKICKLIDNSNFRKSLGNNGREMLINGKFSINQRNKQLLKIIEEVTH